MSAGRAADHAGAARRWRSSRCALLFFAAFVPAQGCGEDTGGSGAAAACPAGEPAIGDGCAVDPVQWCEYGDDLRAECRVRLVCGGGQWMPLGPPAVNSPCGQPLPGPGAPSCPASLSEAGQPCDVEPAACDMGGGAVCACSPQNPDIVCDGCPLPAWQCASPAAGCPADMPDTGQPCEGAQVCQYGSCYAGFFDGRTCEAGVWQVYSEGCPW